MKKISIIILGFLVLTSSCSTTKFIHTWKNPETTSFKPKKLLVVGMTNKFAARKIFEEELQKEFSARNINTTKGATIINQTFTNSKKNEEEIDNMIKKVSDNGFDTILITALKGIDERQNYAMNYDRNDYDTDGFKQYYSRSQDIYHNSTYYDTYKVYRVETSIYKINESENKSLIWVGSLELVNPKTITTTVKGHVVSIIKQLEREGLIKKL